MERLQIVFLNEEGVKTDEVCVRLDAFRSDSPNAALLLQSFFRESLLVNQVSVCLSFSFVILLLQRCWRLD